MAGRESLLIKILFSWMVLFCIIYYYWKAPNRKLLKQELRNMLAIVRVKSASKISHCFSLIKIVRKMHCGLKTCRRLWYFWALNKHQKDQKPVFHKRPRKWLLLMDVDRQFSVYGQDKGKAKVLQDADSIASQAEPGLVDLYFPLTFPLF